MTWPVIVYLNILRLLLTRAHPPSHKFLRASTPTWTNLNDFNSPWWNPVAPLKFLLCRLSIDFLTFSIAPCLRKYYSWEAKGIAHVKPYKREVGIYIKQLPKNCSLNGLLDKFKLKFVDSNLEFFHLQKFLILTLDKFMLLSSPVEFRWKSPMPHWTLQNAAPRRFDRFVTLVASASPKLFNSPSVHPSRWL